MPASSSGPVLSATELLDRLIAFDTVSAKSNLELIAFVEDYLQAHGIASERVTNDEGTKANLFATIGPDSTGGIGLSGHTDVVPVDGQAWDTDPFKMTAANGLLYGRGTSDMKGFIACVLAHVPAFKARKLTVPIHLLFSYDEEVGCTGVRPMIAEFGRRLVRPRLIVVGEPTSMTVVDAHKGIHAFVTEITGLEAHSSMPQLGVDAILAAGKLVTEIGRIAAELEERADGPRFLPPYTTLNVGKITGGTVLNIIPRNATLEWHFRNVPTTDPDEIPKRVAAFAETQLLPDMRKGSPIADIVTRKTNTVPAFQAPAGSEALSLALNLAGQNELFAVCYGTEAGLFENAGCPSIVCGPGDIAQAHKANEFIAEDQLAACSAFLDRLATFAETG